MIETRIFSCLEAFKQQSSPRPLSFLKTSPKFASSAPLEVADETRDFDSTSTFCISSVRMGTNKWSLERGQPRRNSARTFTKRLLGDWGDPAARDIVAGSDSGYERRNSPTANRLRASLEVSRHC